MTVSIVADYREAVRAPDLFTGAQKEGQSDER
jgi:hypothetical protein